MLTSLPLILGGKSQIIYCNVHESVDLKEKRQPYQRVAWYFYLDNLLILLNYQSHLVKIRLQDLNLWVVRGKYTLDCVQSVGFCTLFFRELYIC